MLTPDDALGLEGVDGRRLESLMSEASTVRDERWGPIITFSKNVFVVLTNMCRNRCTYCGFVRDPDSPEARFASQSDVLRAAALGLSAGCTELLFSLGDKPELKHERARMELSELGYASTFEFLLDMCSIVVERTGLLPHVNAGPLTKNQMQLLRPHCASMGMMLETTSVRLTDVGGPHHLCPDKVPEVRIQAIEDAGQSEIPFTTGILIGIGETWAERVVSLRVIQELHERYGHIQEVIVQNYRAKPGLASTGWPEPSLKETLRTIAVARLMLDPGISIQAAPNLLDDPGTAIEAGANDFGGISPVTRDYINPERPWPDMSRLSRACFERGYRLKERLAVYDGYVKRGHRYLDPRIRRAVETMSERRLDAVSPSKMTEHGWNEIDWSCHGTPGTSHTG